MAQPIEKRLENLNTRRRGTDRLNKLAMDAKIEVMAKSVITESYQKRAAAQPYTRYALGSMQEVGPEYTRISIETAERVGKQLDQALAAEGQPVEFRLQGSVPLNVHIRGVSDVDLLTLDRSVVVYHRLGKRANSYLGENEPRTSVQILQDLRAKSEKILRAKYPAADVDISGSKAISLSGGSLARPVDVVPSHWFDTIDYQVSGAEHDRAVRILDKKKAQTIDNWPFLHIKNVHERDLLLRGGLKKAIRLCKNVKADADNEIDLPSFDIAALMFHADQGALGVGYIYELAVLAEAQRFLDYLYKNKSFAATLRTPDGSRLILDSEAKFSGLLMLSSELDDLAREVAKEQNALLKYQDRPSLDESRETLRKSVIAG